MSKNEADVRLPSRAEELLSAWPHPQRDDAGWERSAEAVMSRLPDAAADLALLEPPLPAGADEGRPAEPDAPKKSLLEMARMVEAETTARDDSDLARESLSFANRARTSSPSFHDIRQSSPAPATQTPVSAVPAPLPANVTRLERRSNAGPIGMVVVALAGLAAATFIVIQTRNASQSNVALAPPTPAVAASAPPPLGTSKIEESEVVALGDLGSDKPLGPKNGKGTNQGGASAMADRPKPGELAATEKPAAKKSEPGEPEDSKMRPAESMGATPEKPALGAVQAAVGAVLGSARACVAGQDGASQATIVFGSDGKVTSVAVSGPAAGTNAEACIKAALSKARVQPFSRPTFAASTAIRP